MGILERFPFVLVMVRCPRVPHSKNPSTAAFPASLRFVLFTSGKKDFENENALTNANGKRSLQDSSKVVVGLGRVDAWFGRKCDRCGLV